MRTEAQDCVFFSVDNYVHSIWLKWLRECHEGELGLVAECFPVVNPNGLAHVKLIISCCLFVEELGDSLINWSSRIDLLIVAFLRKISPGGCRVGHVLNDVILVFKLALHRC